MVRLQVSLQVSCILICSHRHRSVSLSYSALCFAFCSIINKVCPNIYPFFSFLHWGHHVVAVGLRQHHVSYQLARQSRTRMHLFWQSRSCNKNTRKRRMQTLKAELMKFSDLIMKRVKTRWAVQNDKKKYQKEGAGNPKFKKNKNRKQATKKFKHTQRINTQEYVWRSHTQDTKIN